MKSVSRAFRALADPPRRQILQELKKGELSAGQIAACFPISGPSISRHLSILKTADLISERREGNRIIYRLGPEEVSLTVGGFLSAGGSPPIVRRPRLERKEGGWKKQSQAGWGFV